MLDCGMNTFPSQPDEGYSEDPLNPSSFANHASPAEMPDWITTQLPRMPLSFKKSTCHARTERRHSVWFS